MQTYAIKNKTGETINTIIADETFVESHYPGAWELIADAPQPVQQIPAVTRRQALLALYRQHGITESDIFSAIDAIEDEGQRYEARVDFTGAATFEHGNPLINQMVHALGIADVDALFAYAATL